MHSNHSYGRFRLDFLAVGWTVLLALASMPLAAQATDQPDRPNIVLIIADDLGWNDCGAYGHPTIRTPSIDRLAREGMLFENAFLTISSCSPSRSSILTGRYPHNTDAEELHWPLPAEQVTFVEQLKANGYWTAAAGKWHLGDEVRDRFDVVRGTDTSGFQLPADAQGTTARFLQPESGLAASGSAQWIPLLRERPTDRPFFLWLAALDPHRPYSENIVSPPHHPADVRLPPFHPDTAKVRQDYALYYDEVSRFDHFVGLVLDELQRQEIADNTVVILISDNGRPFPRCKTTLYDSGIKTPLLVRWPDHVVANSRCRQLVSSVDLAPTILELAGQPRGETFQGHSFVRLLSDPSATIRPYVFAEKNWHDYEDHARAVRSIRYKYIRNYYDDLPNTPPADAVRSLTYREMLRLEATGSLNNNQRQCFVAPRPAEELYDVLADPFELTNLADAAAHRAALLEMRAALATWEDLTDDAPPALRTADEFDRRDGTPLPTRVRPRKSKRQMVREGLAAP